MEMMAVRIMTQSLFPGFSRVCVPILYVSSDYRDIVFLGNAPIPTAFTGGFGNPVIATGELGGSVLLSLLALAAPLAAFVIVILLLWLALRLLRQLRQGTHRANN
jgi:hypothetical protein